MIEQLFSMKGKVCVVTGGSRGLGFYMARGFLAAGARRDGGRIGDATAAESATAESVADHLRRLFK